MSERKVNLFLLGAMRSGTTSLFQYLSEYDEIFPLPVKEPHFFTDPWPQDYHASPKKRKVEKLLKNTATRRAHIMKIYDPDHYEKLYQIVGEQSYIMEASTSYLHAPDACSRMAEYNPEARIVIMLRDPWVRAYSHYRMNISLGKEGRSWEEALQWEWLKYKQRSNSWYGYLGMSSYDKAVEKFKSAFRHVHVISLEALSDRPKEVLADLCHFLNLDFDPGISFEQLNRGRDFKYQGGYNALKKSGLKGGLAKVIPASMRRTLYKKLSKGRDSNIDAIMPEGSEDILQWMQRTSSIYYDLLSGES